MFTNKLDKLLEKQRRRQIAALLAVSSPEEQERIKAAQEAGREWRRKNGALFTFFQTEDNKNSSEQ